MNKTWTHTLITAGLVILSARTPSAQPPVVTMSVTLPNGQVRELTAPESSVARLTYDGTEYEFRPTIQDSYPWKRVLITVFKGATTTAPVERLGEVEVQTGGSSVKTTTKPAFTLAVKQVSPAAVPSGATSLDSNAGLGQLTTIASRSIDSLVAQDQWSA